MSVVATTGDLNISISSCVFCNHCLCLLLAAASVQMQFSCIEVFLKDSENCGTSDNEDERAEQKVDAC